MNADATRLQRVDDLVRELSVQDEPERLVRLFSRQNDLLVPRDGLVTVTRRDLAKPWYRITRSWRWPDAGSPWDDVERLPTFDRGLLGELLYTGRPRILNGLAVAAGDPGREHLEGMRSLACVPAYERGEAVHLVLALSKEDNAFDAADLEHLLFNANLLGRAVNNLALSQQLQEAYRALDREKEQVGRMQRHLLPPELPRIDGLELASLYFTCNQAGGDYYDVLPLPEEQWGLFVADVSGHGTPAAVVMAMIHTLLHSFPGPPLPPVRVFAHINRHLLAVAPEGMFATAFYGVYDPYYRRLRYTSAGHPPPRLRRADGVIEPVDGTVGLPLGVDGTDSWTEREILLAPGDALLLYTDGLLEGTNGGREVFGLRRLDDALRLAPPRAAALVRHVERHYKDFCGGAPDLDDRTLLAAVAVP